MVLIVFITFIVCYLCIGIWNSRHVKTLNDFFIRSRSLSLIETTASLVVTQLGSNMILDTSRKGFEYGVYGIFYPLGISVGLLLLTSTLAERWRTLNINTTAELFINRFKSVYLHKLAGCIGLISLFGILVAQVAALRFVICPYLSIANMCLFIATWLCIVFYTMLGGLSSVINTGFLQGILLYGFFGLFIVTVLITTPFSIAELAAEAVRRPIVPKELTFTQTLSLFILPGLYVIISQTIIQFIIKAKTVKVAKAATSLSSFLLIGFTFVPFMGGLIAKKMTPHIDASTHVIVAVMRALTPTWMLALGIAAISAAIISTADALLLGASSFIIHDIMPKYKYNFLITRLLIALTGLMSLVASYYVEERVVFLILHSYELALSVLFIPSIICLYFPEVPVSTNCAWASCIIGGCSYLLGAFLLPSTVPHILITFGLASLPFVVYKFKMQKLQVK
ncbi:MAG: sodium:solute symporter [Candidatus Babeliales bacterium]